MKNLMTLLVTCALAMTACSATETKGKIGSPAPALTGMTWIQGGPVEIKKGQVAVVEFWATWCPPCVEELPLLNRFYGERRAQGWQVLGVAVDQPPAVRKFLEKLPLAYPVAIATSGGMQLGRSLGNLQGGLPFTVVFGAEGRIRHRKIGQVQAEDLSRWADTV